MDNVEDGALALRGTVTAVSASSVTIKTSTATTAYSVTSACDIDKNGEATASALVVGDKVTFSVDSTSAKQIDSSRRRRGQEHAQLKRRVLVLGRNGASRRLVRAPATP